MSPELLKTAKTFGVILTIAAILVGGTWVVAMQTTASERAAKDTEIERLKSLLTDKTTVADNASKTSEEIQRRLTVANADLAAVQVKLASVSEVERKWNEASGIFGRAPTTWGPRSAGNAKKADFKERMHRLFPPTNTKHGDRDDHVIDAIFDADWDS